MSVDIFDCDSSGEFSSESYSEELDRVLQRYEEAAKNEQFYLLQFSFLLKNSPYTIDCGLSPGRSFSPVVRIRMQSAEITFSSYEWVDFLEALRKIQQEFFNNCNLTEADILPFYCDDSHRISLSKLIYDENVKQVMVMKYFSQLYLDENDVQEMLDLPLISHRLTLLEELNFCLYYYNVLNTVRKSINSTNCFSIIEHLTCYCNFECNTLLANALRDYIYYYKTSIECDFNKAI